MSDPNELNITLFNPLSGASELIPLPANLPIAQVTELATALLGFDSSQQQQGQLQVFKDGRGLPSSSTLQASGVQSGDVLVIATAPPAQPRQRQQQPSQQLAARPPSSSSQAAAAGSSGGLDFSSLLSSAGAGGPQSSSSSQSQQAMVYYPGMSVEDAMSYNPHPRNFITVLFQHDHLFKELRYHQPQLAQLLHQAYHNTNNTPQQSGLNAAEAVWRTEMVKGGISSAWKRTQQYHKQQEMQQRLQQNPNDETAKQYFSKQAQDQQIQEQYHQMMEEYPESLGRVLMLYVPAKINGHDIQAFCDSGAQMTIMSFRVAQQVGVDHLIDTRFAGTATGVGTGKIKGRIHIVQLQLGQHYYPCSVSVMETPDNPNVSEMPFLLGLDMMKRHLVHVDLQHGVLRFPNLLGGNKAAEEIPFLHEKDLDTQQGGTKGFNAELANQELLQRLQNETDEDDDKMDEEPPPKKPDAPTGK